LLLLLPLSWWGRALWFRLLHPQEKEEFVFCDMETLSSDGEEFICKGRRLFNGRTRTEEVALSGRYSAKCTPEQKYGPTVVIPDLQEGDLVEAEVWRYDKQGLGGLVLQGDWGFWDIAVDRKRQKGAWALLHYRLALPLGVRSATLKIYPFFQHGEAVYFDDLNIRIVRRAAATSAALNDTLPSLDIQLDVQAYEKLRAKREEALLRGNLISGKEDLVPARLLSDGKKIPVKLRLKGDLLDHLQGKKWSFRILCDEGYSWRDMRVFSIHNAASRYYLNEWMYHRLLLDDSLLTTPYDFVKVSLNGDLLGIYAYEEHFTDHLLESQGREPGIIIRIDEAGHWLHASEDLKDRPAWYQSATYLPYERKKILKDRQRYAQWLRAQELLYGFFKGNLKPSEVFDTLKMARFFALVDVARAFHALHFTNIRFYYDPLNDRLEPLGYDGNSTDGPRWFKLPALVGSHYNSRSPSTYEPGIETAYLAYRFFNDMDFTKLYIRELQRVTSDSFRDAFLRRHLPEIEAREAFIRQEYTSYDFKWGDFFRNAEEIRKLLNPLALVSVKAWRGQGGRIVLENYHLLPVELVGFGHGNQVDKRLPKPLVLEAYNKLVPVRRYRLNVSGNYKYVFVRTLGLPDLHRERLAKWEAPELQPESPASIERPDFVQDLGNGIWSVPSGKYQLDKDWVIPAGHRLLAGPGVEFDLVSRAMIISHSPLEFSGRADAPVRIYSSDGSGQGLLLLETSGKSILTHVRFEGMNDRRSTPPFTRAVFTAYKSELVLSHCVSETAAAENALHFLQSQYLVEDLFVYRASGDALDIDRSTGHLSNLRVEVCGEDGLEISAGYAVLETLFFSHVRESAVRVHVAAEAEAKHIRMEQCGLGITVQDAARFSVEDVYAKDIRELFLAYRKSENASSGGQLEVQKVEVNGVDQLYLMDGESKIVIDSEEKTVQ